MAPPNTPPETPPPPFTAFFGLRSLIATFFFLFVALTFSATAASYCKFFRTMDSALIAQIGGQVQQILPSHVAGPTWGRTQGGK
jgi:hypothetical protein